MTAGSGFGLQIHPCDSSSPKLADELRELVAAYRKVATDFRERYAERSRRPDTRPDGTLPVETLFFSLQYTEVADQREMKSFFLKGFSLSPSL